MSRQKKDAKQFCCYLRLDILEVLSKYSLETAIPKTAIVEKALLEFFKKNKIPKVSKNRNE